MDETQTLAVAGWTRFVLEATRDLPDEHPVDERMALALVGEQELPGWLLNEVRTWLVGYRGQALVEKTIARASG